jgi:ubiquinone/menaquinone biosynthesis C-methylase UbiE
LNDEPEELTGKHHRDWDDFARRYDGIFLEDPIYIETLRAIIDSLGNADNKVALDLGCGTGNTISEILKRFPGARVIGIDPSEGMRKRCALKFAGDTRVVVEEGDALNIPFPDEQFDYVISNYTLHHIPPQQRAECAAELFRVLKTRGLLIYSDVFCSVDAPREDAARTRDIIEKSTAQALYSLDHGAYDMMMLKLEALPYHVKSEGEYLTTPERWIEALESSGLVDFEVIQILVEQFGLLLIRALKP